MWLPNNPLMQRDGVQDSREEALAYLEETVGDQGRCTDRDRKEAFVDSVADFVNLAERQGIRLVRSPDYPDYYPELKGGKVGRTLEVQPFDVKRIGEGWESCQAPVAMPVKTDDAWLLGRAWSTPGGFVRGAQLVFRALGGVARGRKLAGIGAALAAQYTRRYLRTFTMDPKVTKAMAAEGVLVKGKTLDELATGMGVEPARLRATVDRFNGFCAAGVDGDFGRGNSAYDRYYSDPLVRPNPNLGTVEKGPFLAYRVVIGDLGTKGGVVTDADARAPARGWHRHRRALLGREQLGRGDGSYLPRPRLHDRPVRRLRHSRGKAHGARRVT